MHFRYIWEYWRKNFWQIAYDLSIFPLPKFSCVRYHKPCHYPKHCCVSSKGVLPYSLFAGHCRLSPIQVGSETGIQRNCMGSPDGKCAFNNRYMVDGNLRQQKIKGIVQTWTGPKMVIIERHSLRVLCPKP